MNRTRASSLDAFGTRDQRNRIYPALEASDGSTLSLDFTQMSSLDSRFTFDRSSSTTAGAVGTATFINSSGYVQSVAAGVPRFDYNPTTLAPRGLLIEGAATNLVTNSQNITTGTWTVGGNTTLTANTTEVTDPAGGNTATKIALSANAYCSRAQLVTVLANTAYTFSFWIRGTAGSTQRIFEVGGGDLVSQTTLTYTNTGWTRVQVQFTSATITTIYVYVCSKSTSAGSSDVLYVWGAQLEAGNGASSYIPTTTAAVTRAADQCFIADASPFQVSTTNGTLYWSGIFHKQTPGSYTEIVGFMDSTQPTFEVYTNGLNVGVAARGLSLNSGGANEVTRTYTLNAQTRYACSVNTTSNPIVAAVLNGGTVGTNNKSGTGDLYASTRFVLGRQPTSSYANYMPCMTFAQVKYWPVTKTQTELNLLTTT